jgi:LysR family hydrogen peroxide-inducible transcriptional activator
MTLLPALATHHMPEDEHETHVLPFTDPTPTRDIRLVGRRRHKQPLVDAFAHVLHDALPPTVTRP